MLVLQIKGPTIFSLSVCVKKKGNGLHIPDLIKTGPRPTSWETLTGLRNKKRHSLLRCVRACVSLRFAAVSDPRPKVERSLKADEPRLRHMLQFVQTRYGRALRRHHNDDHCSQLCRRTLAVVPLAVSSCFLAAWVFSELYHDTGLKKKTQQKQFANLLFCCLFIFFYGSGLRYRCRKHEWQTFVNFYQHSS